MIRKRTGRHGGATEPEDSDSGGTMGVVRAVLATARRNPAETIRKLLSETIWRWDLAALPRPQRMLVQALRILYLVGRGFVSSRAQQQAMALTYTTMLALVPAFAIMVALFSVRGLQEARGRLESFIIDVIAASPEQEATLSNVLAELSSNLQGSGGVAGFAFFVFLFFTIIALLSTLEKTLNDIWGIKRQRSFINKFVTYWCIATLGPIFLGTALVQGSSLEHQMRDLSTWGRDAGSSLLGGSKSSPSELEQGSATGEPEAEDVERFMFGGVGGALAAEMEAKTRNRDLREAGPGETLEYVLTGTRAADSERGLSLASFGLTIITFTLLYAFLPNTRVRLKPALVGALVAALVWSATKWGLALSSASLVRYNTIYGSLATVPITMFWLYLTWLVVILGAELTFALQNLKSQRKEELAAETTELFAELVALRLSTAIARAFEHGQRPPDKDALAEETGAPLNLCALLLFHLTEDGLLREIELDGDARGYVPARPLDRITVSDIIDSLRERRGVSFELNKGADLDVVSKHLEQASAASKAMAQRVNLRHLVNLIEGNGGELKLESPDPDAIAAQVAITRTLEQAKSLPGSGSGGSLRPA